MPSYRLSFMNDIPGHGKPFHCCQRSIVIRAARNAERAAEAAKKRFARREGICQWNIHADRIELAVIDFPARPDGALQQGTGEHKRVRP